MMPDNNDLEEEMSEADWEEQQREQAAEDEAWEADARERRRAIYDLLSRWPNNVLFMLRRMLDIETQLPGHAGRDTYEIRLASEVIAEIFREDRGVDPNEAAWEQSTVRQVLSEFPDDILKLLLAGMQVHMNKHDAPKEFFQRRMDLVTDIGRSRTHGSPRTDIDESLAGSTGAGQTPPLAARVQELEAELRDARVQIEALEGDLKEELDQHDRRF